MNTDSIILKKILNGQKSSITIRNLTVSDVTETYCNWLNDTEVNKYLESRFTKWDMSSLLKYFQDKSRKELLLAIIDDDTTTHIGNVKISSVDPYHNRVDIGIIIGDKRFWGKGIATAAIEIVTNYCFTNLGVHKVTAGAYINNKASIKAFLKNNYMIEGEMQDHYLTPSGWVNGIYMGKLRK
ncbi:hypothetical protein SH16_00835 [Aeromonas caviae]|uniref:GNAT family N-acetyltransferase n=1 Tax=Aeromonas caviae TaxID=648 RepID=UPI000652044B|nr:GNAT family protein [Aeromonas caviae]KLV47112.1 hypothetical protein SH16_00835 [Aeromonas caviae]MDH0136955.1 GNAT family N-acetyltransferase [Aeromonas caviae]